jgi:hypothetical protein
MMALAITEDPWIDYLIISRLGGYYATPKARVYNSTQGSGARVYDSN